MRAAFVRLASILAAPFENSLLHFAFVYFHCILVEPIQYVRGCESPSRARGHDIPAPQRISASAIEHLKRTGYLVIDGLLSPEELTAARSDADGLDDYGSTWQHGDAVRTDAMRWWIEDGRGRMSPRPGLTTAMRRLRGVASELAHGSSSAAAALGGWDGFDADSARLGRGGPIALLGVPLACQIARYDATWVTGTPHHYRPHRDGVLLPRWSLRALEKSGTSAREVTAILYLNNWSVGESDGSSPSQHGGELVLHLGAAADDVTGKSASHRLSIAPIGGRLVLFDSRRMLHEVLPHTSASARVALTCWFGGRFCPHSVLLRPG
jgi:hypothetical protein